MSRRVLSFFALALLVPMASGAQTTPTRYIAFGDSITWGFADDPNRAEPGYPPRLEALLNSRGVSAEVENRGLNNETTGEALSRINTVLNNTPGDVLLLMEGTNDINARVSNETIIANLDSIAQRAEARSMRVVHATVIPRDPRANYDGDNQVTADLAGKIRELAWFRQRRLADPFEVFFFRTPNVFSTHYAGGSDRLHPNPTGYDLLARVFADVLTNVDSVPPVTGRIEPRNDEQGVPATTPIRIDLYDFGTGIDLPATRLLINNQEVETPITGSSNKLEIRYDPPQPFTGVVFVGIRSRDTANPPNTLERMLAQFVIAGTTFLRGDIDRDGRVDGVDLLAFAPRFGAREGDARYRTFADLNGDGFIDGQDLAILGSNFGRSSI